MISDVELALAWEKPGRLEPGFYNAPAAWCSWDGMCFICTPSGMPLDPVAALLSPDLAETLESHGNASQALPGEPTIAALVADYEGALRAFAACGGVAGEDAFLTRLATCRGCRVWTEEAREGRGRCESVRCACSKKLLWLAGERCPEGKWA